MYGKRGRGSHSVTSYHTKPNSSAVCLLTFSKCFKRNFFKFSIIFLVYSRYFPSLKPVKDLNRSLLSGSSFDSSSGSGSGSGLSSGSGSGFGSGSGLSSGWRSGFGWRFGFGWRSGLSSSSGWRSGLSLGSDFDWICGLSYIFYYIFLKFTFSNVGCILSIFF